MKKLFLLVFILYLGICQGNGQIFQRNSLNNTEKGSSGKPLHRKKKAKVKEPRSVTRAKKKQEAGDRKNDREYKKYIKWSRKRTIDIQTPEVQARMKNDKKDAASRDKVKRKTVRSGSKKAGSKYK
jgi:hypothetical protein